MLATLEKPDSGRRSKYLAHSAREGCEPQEFSLHTSAVRHLAVQYANEGLKYAARELQHLVKEIEAAALLHDAGKLTDDNQAILCGEVKSNHLIKHEDAGCLWATTIGYEYRQYAALWEAPVIVTTAVSFFETLAGHTTKSLRKLHQLPGCVVIIDESHASTPYRLYPQNERWMEELAESWGPEPITTYWFAGDCQVPANTCKTKQSWAGTLGWSESNDRELLTRLSALTQLANIRGYSMNSFLFLL